MTRAVRQMNLAGLDDAGLKAMRDAVEKALPDGADDFNHLLEDIDAEIDLRKREPLL